MTVFATFPEKAAALAVEANMIDVLDPEYNRVKEVPKMWDRDIWIASLEDAD